MLIILEGADGVGKSTLAAQIAQRLRNDGGHVQIIHKSPPRDHPLDEYVWPLLNYRAGTSDHIICDRWHLGEYVYPDIKGRATKMDRAVSAYVNLFLQGKGAATIILVPGLMAALKRSLQRGETFVDEDENERAYHSFQSLSRRREVNAIWLSDPGVDRVIDYARHKERQARHAPFVTWVGPRKPDVLVLGDNRICRGDPCGHPRRHPKNGTAFGPYLATSGHFLFSHLDWHPNWAYANACDVDNLQVMWHASGKPRVVTLGARANNIVTMYNIPHAAVPHPQYVRRFLHGSGAAYAELIEQVAGTERKELKWRPSSVMPQDSGLIIRS